jgi:hypothetical protein
MEQNYTNQQPQFIQQQALPYSTSVLVLGILSIVTCWCYGIPGVVMGIIALVQAKKANEMYASSPGQYSPSSYNNLKAGRVCAIIGLILSCCYLLLIIIYFAFVGTLLLSIPWDEIGRGQYY